MEMSEMSMSGIRISGMENPVQQIQTCLHPII